MTCQPRIALTATLFSLIIGPEAVAQTYLGPLPYLSAADRPPGFLTGTSVLEDFEDVRLDFGLTANVGAPYGPAFNADSVDGDDGIIDGSGTNGRSFFGFGPVTFTFPATVREAGIVWTDGPCNTPVTFEAFGPGMVSLGLHGPFLHADCSTAGETPEDRFYGVQDPNGIVAIKVHSVGPGQSFEVDHVQFDALGTTYCTSLPNSSGRNGIVTIVGSDLVVDNEITLVASKLPSSVFGYFIASRTAGFVPSAGGSQGNLCLGGAIGRFNAGIFQSGAAGWGRLQIDLGAIPAPTGPVAIQPGESWKFQVWHRDAVPGTGTATSNFSDAVELVFQ